MSRVNNYTEQTRQKNENITEYLDYYSILGIGRDSKKLDIKRAYQKKLKKFHPDKTKPTAENKLKYKLIREAGDILTHPLKRKAYDTQCELNNTKQNFVSQRESFNKFIQLQENKMTDEDRKTAKLNFDKSIHQMNIEHNINEDIKQLSSVEYNRRMEDVILQREQEEFEINQDNIFKNKKFNSMVFNNIFDNKKENATDIQDDSISLYKNEVQAYNCNENEGVGLDNYSSLYTSGEYTGHNELYAGIKNGLLESKDIDNNDSISDDISIDSLDEADYKLEYKTTDGVLDTEIKCIISERKKDDSIFTNMTEAEFGSALDDRYGISKQFGFMIGNDRNGHQKTNSNILKKSKIKIYKELTQE
jgi:curved DNA-binding protein CbpA